MPLVKQSYKSVRHVFPNTSLGKITLSLSVGELMVLAVDSMGIKARVAAEALVRSEDQFIVACKEADAEKFQAMCKELGRA